MKKLLLTLFSLLLLTGGSSLLAQNSVGIGTETPNANAVLQLVSPGNNQGLMIPSLTTAQRTATGFQDGLTDAENGLMVFDNTEGQFYYWLSGSWELVSGLELTAGDGISIDPATGILSNTGDLDIANEIQDLELVGNLLSITLNAAATAIDLTPYLDNQTAAEVAVTPNVDLTSNTVQAALEELQAEVIAASGGPLALADGNIFVGDATNLAAEVPMTGDVGIDNTGATSVNEVGGATAGDIATATGIVNGATSLDLDDSDDLTTADGIESLVDVGPFVTPAIGDFLKFNGTEWVNNSSIFPVSGSSGDVGPVFDLTHTGGGVSMSVQNNSPVAGDYVIQGESTGNSIAGYFVNNEAAATNQALYTHTRGSGASLVAFGLGTGPAARFSNQSPVANTSTTLEVDNQDEGGVADFSITQAGNTSDVLTIQTAGSGNAINVISGDINMGTNTITNLIDPTNPQDAATRNFVLNQVGALGLGTAAFEDVGAAAFNVVQLDGAGDLPSLNAAALTNLSSASVGPNGLGSNPFFAGTEDLNTALDNIGFELNNIGLLTGQGIGATDLGTFTGATISDNTDMTGALQELETAVESAGLATLTDGTLLIGDGGNAPVERTVTGDLFIDNAGFATIQPGVVSDTEISDVAVGKITGAPNLDVDATDDLTNVTAPAAGDVSGDFATGLTVDAVGGETAGDIATATGIVNGATALDVDATDDLTNVTAPAAGDVSGDFATGLTVDAVGGETAANVAGVTASFNDIGSISNPVITDNQDVISAIVQAGFAIDNNSFSISNVQSNAVSDSIYFEGELDADSTFLKGLIDTNTGSIIAGLSKSVSDSIYFEGELDADSTFLKGLIDVTNALPEGNIRVGSATNLVSDIDASGDGFMLIGDGTTVNSVNVTGDVDIDNAGNATVNSVGLATATDVQNTVADFNDIGLLSNPVITDNQDVISAIDEAGLAIDNTFSTLGVPVGSSDIGTFIGATITDNTDVAGALQELETAVENAGLTLPFTDTQADAGALFDVNNSGAGEAALFSNNGTGTALLVENNTNTGGTSGLVASVPAGSIDGGAGIFETLNSGNNDPTVFVYQQGIGNGLLINKQTAGNSALRIDYNPTSGSIIDVIDVNSSGSAVTFMEFRSGGTTVASISGNGRGDFTEGVTVGNATEDFVGTLRWNGSNFQGNTDGTPGGWVDLDVASLVTEDGNSNLFTGSNAGSSLTPGVADQNTFYGVDAGSNVTDGDFNTFIGSGAGFSNTIGSSNTFLGVFSGLNTLDGDNNVFIGDAAGNDNTSGSNNVMVGFETGLGISPFGTPSSTGNNLTLIGNGADAGADGLTNATAIGNQAVVPADNTIALGNGAMSTVLLSQGSDKIIQVQDNTTVSGNNLSINAADGAAGTFDGGNIILNPGINGGGGVDGIVQVNSDLDVTGIISGDGSGLSGVTVNGVLLDDINNFVAIGENTGGISGFNTFIGDDAGSSISTGTDNTFIGSDAGTNTLGGGGNVFLGSGAGFDNSGGGANTFLGAFTGNSNTSGFNNIFIGNGAGSGFNPGGAATTTNSTVVLIGFEADAAAGTGITNAVALGANAVVPASNTIALGDGNINELFLSEGLDKTIRVQNNSTGDGNSLSLISGNGAGGFNGGNINLTPGTGVTDGFVNVNGDMVVSGTLFGDGGGLSNISISGVLIDAVDNFVAVGNATGGVVNSNTYIGANTGQNNTIGIANTFLGSNAGINNTTGNSNIFIGDAAGFGATSGTASATGSDNILIGPGADVGADPTSNAIAIGSGSVAGADNSVAIGTSTQSANANTIILGDGTNSNFDVGIGTDAPAGALDVNVGLGAAYVHANSNVASGLLQITNDDIGGAGDASIRLNIVGDSYLMGVDNSDNDIFKINAGSLFSAGAANFAITPTGLVGIGNATPSTALDVSGTITAIDGTINPKVSLENTLNQDVPLRFLNPSYTWMMGVDQSALGDFVISSSASFGTNDRFVIDRTSGQVNITTGPGTSNPFIISSTAGAGQSMLFQANGIETSLGNNGTWSRMGTTTNHDFSLFANGTDLIRLTAAGEIGIGTLAPITQTKVNIEGDDNLGTPQLIIENINTGGFANGMEINLGILDPTVNNRYITFTKDGAGRVIAGSIGGDGVGGVAFNQTSDRRLKTNIDDLSGSLQLIDQIQPRKFSYKTKPDKQVTGFIAQELYEVFPEVVSGTPDNEIDNPMMVNYSGFSALLTAGVQELHQKIKALEAVIEKQNQQLEELKAVNNNKDEALGDLQKDMEQIKLMLGLEANAKN